jgi:hypothetical protein
LFLVCLHTLLQCFQRLCKSYCMGIGGIYVLLKHILLYFNIFGLNSDHVRISIRSTRYLGHTSVFLLLGQEVNRSAYLLAGGSVARNCYHGNNGRGGSTYHADDYDVDSNPGESRCGQQSWWVTMWTVIRVSLAGICAWNMCAYCSSFYKISVFCVLIGQTLTRNLCSVCWQTCHSPDRALKHPGICSLNLVPDRERNALSFC